MATSITTKRVGTAVALTAAAAAAAAGAYWLYGAKDAPKHRKMARSWMLKARGEVMDAVSKLKDVDKEQYLAIVDQVVKRYSGMQGVSAAEIQKMVKDLRASWQHMQAAQKPAKKLTRKARKVTK